MFRGKVVAMATAREIEQAIERLSKDKLAELRASFDEFDAPQWDRHFEQDVRAGRLDALVDQAPKDLESNRCTEL
jgi:hypothetical protein